MFTKTMEFKNFFLYFAGFTLVFPYGTWNSYDVYIEFTLQLSNYNIIIMLHWKNFYLEFDITKKDANQGTG